jgi:pimeloyl-ACP methyl ester carboxylesterase
MKFRLLMVMFLAITCGAMAEGKGIPHISLPADFSGTLDGADYIIRVPANWNDTLLMFAHGTQLGSPVAQAAPVAWPAVSPPLEQQLLELGYAVAGSGYRSDSDKEAVQQTLALTNFFKGMIGNPSRIIIWGNSLGGKIALKLIEEHPGIYDGAIANGAPGAGAPENADMGLSFSLAYAATFGWHDDLWGSVEDLRDDLDFFADVRPIFLAEASPFPQYPQWEFIRLILKLPSQAFYGVDPISNFPFIGLAMWKATGQRAALEAENGGPVAENFDLHYTLSTAEKQYLASLGLDADQLLAYMNERTNVIADRAARIHAEHWGGLSGRLRRPVLTMHAKFDGLAFVAQESYYASLAQAADCSDLLVQAFVNVAGHSSFSADQYLSTLAAMESWLDTGVRPDASLLPASKGFDLGYVPPPWPF